MRTSTGHSWRPRLRRIATALGVLPAATAAVLLIGSTAGATPVGHTVTPAQGLSDHAGAGLAPGQQQVVTPDAPAGLPGLDVSGYQPGINRSTVKANGAQFAYIKATEGTSYQNPEFSAQYSGSYNVGLIRGAYHFARPDSAGGAAQADYFVAHGGGWSADGQTLPGMLDIEWGPNDACYGLSQSAMVSWINAFLNEYHAKTGRWATIYTNTNWWIPCTGNYAGFAANDPLVLANYTSSPTPLPAGWSYATIWQWADSGVFPGDQDVFNGSHDRLLALANNTA